MLLLSTLSAQQKPAEPVQQEPPEEDKSIVHKEYAFNPVQAAKEIKTGEFYTKKGNWKAAAARFEEATKWNPGLGEAWLKLAEAREKLKDAKGAREAYAKYLEVEPDAKNASHVRKKLGK